MIPGVHQPTFALAHPPDKRTTSTTTLIKLDINYFLGHLVSVLFIRISRVTRNISQIYDESRALKNVFVKRAACIISLHALFIALKNVDNTRV